MCEGSRALKAAAKNFPNPSWALYVHRPTNQLTGHANFQICRSIPKFPEFWHSESTPVNFARSHFGVNRGARCAGAGGGHRARGEAKRPSVAIPPITAFTGAVVIELRVICTDHILLSDLCCLRYWSEPLLRRHNLRSHQCCHYVCS